MKVNLLETCYVNRTGLSYSYQITKDRVLANIDLEQIHEKIIFFALFYC